MCHVEYKIIKVRKENYIFRLLTDCHNLHPYLSLIAVSYRLLLSRFVFHTVAVLQWHGHPRGMGIPIPKTLVIIWFLGIGMPKPRVSPYHCDNRRETRGKRRLGTRQSNPSFDYRSQEEFSRRYFALEWFYLTREIVHHSAILQSNFIHFSFASL